MRIRSISLHSRQRMAAVSDEPLALVARAHWRLRRPLWVPGHDDALFGWLLVTDHGDDHRRRAPYRLGNQHSALARGHVRNSGSTWRSSGAPLRAAERLS